MKTNPIIAAGAAFGWVSIGLHVEANGPDFYAWPYYAIGVCILLLAVAEMWRRLPWRK